MIPLLKYSEYICCLSGSCKSWQARCLGVTDYQGLDNFHYPVKRNTRCGISSYPQENNNALKLTSRKPPGNRRELWLHAGAISTTWSFGLLGPSSLHPEWPGRPTQPRILSSSWCNQVQCGTAPVPASALGQLTRIPVPSNCPSVPRAGLGLPS